MPSCPSADTPLCIAISLRENIRIDAGFEDRLDPQDDAPIDLVLAHPTEDAIDLLQRLDSVVDRHLAIARELQTFGEVEPGSDDRSSDRLAHQDGAEDVQVERTG